jgi:hypothetical protein
MKIMWKKANKVKQVKEKQSHLIMRRLNLTNKFRKSLVQKKIIEVSREVNHLKDFLQTLHLIECTELIWNKWYKKTINLSLKEEHHQKVRWVLVNLDHNQIKWLLLMTK